MPHFQPNAGSHDPEVVIIHRRRSSEGDLCRPSQSTPAQRELVTPPLDPSSPDLIEALPDTEHLYWQEEQLAKIYDVVHAELELRRRENRYNPIRSHHNPIYFDFLRLSGSSLQHLYGPLDAHIRTLNDTDLRYLYSQITIETTWAMRQLHYDQKIEKRYSCPMMRHQLLQEFRRSRPAMDSILHQYIFSNLTFPDDYEEADDDDSTPEIQQVQQQLQHMDHNSNGKDRNKRSRSVVARPTNPSHTTQTLLEFINSSAPKAVDLKTIEPPSLTQPPQQDEQHEQEEQHDAKLKAAVDEMVGPMVTQRPGQSSVLPVAIDTVHQHKDKTRHDEKAQ